MKIPLYQVDAFTSKIFNGNPAAVCPLKDWIDDDIMQKIAQENNLSETAFFVKNKSVLIFGAGGVVQSIIFILKTQGVKKIYLSNRTKSKAEDIRLDHVNNINKSIINKSGCI